MDRTLSLAVEDCEWLDPLATGDVAPDEVDLAVRTDLSPGDRTRAALRGELDVAEISMGTYVTSWRDLDLVAIPAFPRRFFPHSWIYVPSDRDADVDAPADLAGREVGILGHDNSLALWTKGILAEQYDLDLTAVEWRVSTAEPLTGHPLGGEPIEGYLPERLVAGDINAMVLPPSHGDLARQYDGVGRLFGDAMDEERAYYGRTGVYPILHAVVVQETLADEHPGVIPDLMRAFRRSYEAFDERTNYPAKYPLAWWRSYREQELELFGDVWARSFDLEPNLRELETVVRFAHQQGLNDEAFDPAEMFLSVED